MSDKYCDILKTLGSNLDPTSITMGKKKIDQIMDQLYQWDKEATENAGNTKKVNEIRDNIYEYGHQQVNEKEGIFETPGSQLDKLFTGDKQVENYLMSMSVKDYTKLRADIAHWFGSEIGIKGALGRNAEEAFKNAKFKAMEKHFSDVLGDKLTLAKGEGFLTRSDLENLLVYETRMDDLVKIVKSPMFDSLDESTKKLDSIAKVDHAIQKFSEIAKTEQDLIEMQKIGQDLKEIYETLPPEIQQRVQGAYRTIANAANKEKSVTWGDLDAAAETIRTTGITEGERLARQSKADDALALAQTEAANAARQGKLELAALIEGKGKNVTPEWIQYVKAIDDKKTLEQETILTKIQNLMNDDNVPEETRLAMRNVNTDTATSKIKDLIKTAENEKQFIETYNIDNITETTAKATYDVLKRTNGQHAADSILRRKAQAMISDIDQAISQKGRSVLLTGQRLDDLETRLMDDVTIDVNVTYDTIESLAKIANKISPEGLDGIKVLLRMFTTLEPTDSTRIIRGMNKTPTAYVAAGIGKDLIKFFGLVVPAWFFGTAFIAQSTYENMWQFSAWTGKSTQNKIDGFVNRLDELNQFLTVADYMSTLLGYAQKIPVIGELYTWGLKLIDVSLKSYRIDAEKTMKELEAQGLLKADKTTPLGYSATSREDQERIFKEDPTKLFQNDATFVGQFADLWGEHTRIFGKDGKELTSAKAMALYLNTKEGKGLDKKLVESSGLSQLDVGDYTGIGAPTTRKQILDWGDKTLGATTTEKTQTQKETSTLPEMKALNEGKLNCNGECTTEYVTNMKKAGFGIYQKKDGTMVWARPNEADKDWIVVSAPIEEIKETSGSGGSESTNEEDIYTKNIETNWNDASSEEKKQWANSKIEKGKNIIEEADKAGIKKTEISTMNVETQIAFREAIPEYTKTKIANGEMTGETLTELETINKDQVAKGIQDRIDELSCTSGGE